jgi:crotonobetainyl-CoA:carnitine CoA-transferase CaiB-like acyl-CoA transferase
MSGLPLDGIRVVDLTWVVSGPQATRVLADLGAEVIKIEGPNRGEQTRQMTFNPRVVATQGLFGYFNRNKLAATLNLATTEGRDIFARLVKISDVVICNFSAHVMERWGFDFAGLSAINPAIVYVSMPGFGHSGPYQDYQSNGPTIQAISGLTFLGSMPDMPATGWGYSYMDHTAGYYGAAAVIQGIYYRNRTGQGQFIDLAQSETASTLVGPYILDYTANGRRSRRPGMPTGNRSTWPAGAPHGVYPCEGEDRWCAITVFTEEEWAGFRKAIGDPAWAADPKYQTLEGRLANQDELDRQVSGWTSQRSQKEVMTVLQKAGVAAGMVQTPTQRADEDPQLEARGHIIWMETAGDENEDPVRVRTDTVPMTIPSRPPETYRWPPVSGQDNALVYGEILGLSQSEIEDYTARGIF